MNNYALERLLEADGDALPDEQVSADAFLDKFLGGGYDQPKHSLDKKRWTRAEKWGVEFHKQKLENHTYLRRFKASPRDEQYTYAIQLHNTDVLTCKPDGRVIVSTGGWKTLTTKARINDHLRSCLPNRTKGLPHVWQNRRQWYWVSGGYDGQPGVKHHFNDGDWFEPDGTLHIQGDPLAEAVAAEFDVESAACNYIEQEVGRYDWKANWTHHRQQPGVQEKIQAWLDHYEYGGTAEEVIQHIDGTMMKSEGRWL